MPNQVISYPGHSYLGAKCLGYELTYFLSKQGMDCVEYEMTFCVILEVFELPKLFTKVRNDWVRIVFQVSLRTQLNLV